MKIIDISLPLNNQTPIYPENVPLSVSMHHAMPKYSTQLSAITFGSHTGTHIDAPAHCLVGGLTLDQIPLETLIGPCRVLDFSQNQSECVTQEMLQSKNVKKGERVLLKTKNSIRGFKEFYKDFVYLDGDGADYLAGLGVLLVGIDSLSIKKSGGPDSRPHTALLSKNIPIIEGLNMSTVIEGEYKLICLPLNFTGIEGAPARAVLIER
ncbi:MAG: cyclase family protein [Patescibacteria group bacterium]|nr:cyclase family protein [Patescibacteria group bacterium]